MKDSIKGTFKSLTTIEDGKLVIGFTSSEGQSFSVPIVTLEREDGGGRRFLINYNCKHVVSGYVDFQTMKGYVYEN